MIRLRRPWWCCCRGIKTIFRVVILTTGTICDRLWLQRRRPLSFYCLPKNRFLSRGRWRKKSILARKRLRNTGWEHHHQGRSSSHKENRNYLRYDHNNRNSRHRNRFHRHCNAKQNEENREGHRLSEFMATRLLYYIPFIPCAVFFSRGLIFQQPAQNILVHRNCGVLRKMKV